MRFGQWCALVVGTLAAGCGLVALAALQETRLQITGLRAARQVVDTPHGAVEYIAWGEGPAALALHGAGGGFDQGRLLAETLGGDGFRWIAPSRFGYLGSALPQDASTTAQAEALVALLDGLGVPRVAVLAMSGGAPPALKLAELHPERVAGLVLLSPAPFSPFRPDVSGRPIPAWAYEVLLGNDIVYWVLTKTARGRLAAAFDARPGLLAMTTPTERAFVEELIDSFSPASRRIPGVRNEVAAVDPRNVYALEAISAPTLVVHAADDRLNPMAVGETIARRVPGAQFMRLERGGHLLLGHHAALRETIGRFLTQASAVGDPSAAIE